MHTREFKNHKLNQRGEEYYDELCSRVSDLHNWLANEVKINGRDLERTVAKLEEAFFAARRGIEVKGDYNNR